MNFYNDIDEGVCSWLRELIKDNLIPHGDVSSTSITELNPDDLRKYTQCHFFCGIAGWLEAFRLAGIDHRRRVWTGSCPCQPFSAAGAQEGQADARHLWPAFMRLIRECRPDCVFGEQVEGAIGFGWLDGIQADLEAEGYAVGHCVLGAHSAGSPNIRQRLYWVAYAENTGLQRGEDSAREGGRTEPESDNSGLSDGTRIGLEGSGSTDAGGGTEGIREERGVRSGSGCVSGWLSNADSTRPHASPHRGVCGREEVAGSWDEQPERPGGECSRLGHPSHTGSQRHGSLGRELDASGREDAQRHGGEAGFWGRYDLIPCRDGKARRIEPGVKPLVDGLPGKLVRGGDTSPRPLEENEANQEDPNASAVGRILRLKGYGNAINPHTAALFIRVAEDARSDGAGLISQPPTMELED